MEMDMEKNKIPPQLQKNGFGFVKLKPRSKIPFEQDWQNKPYAIKDIEPWILQDANYGVLGGHSGLIVIDADTAVMSELVRSKLPQTFTVKTPRAGHHFYYICPDIKKKIVLKKDGEHFGEIISSGSQVVGPGSIHPDTGTEYEVMCDLEIAAITREQVFSELVEYIPTEFPQKDTEAEISDLSVLDVLTKAGVETKRIGGQLVGGHPVHGSTNNNNFVVSPDKNVWHCFRCGSGGGAIALIAVLEQLIDCREAAPGGLRGDKFNETLKIAGEKYGFQIKQGGKSENIILSEDRLTALESKIKAIPADTAPVRLPQLLDPILKEISDLNIAQGDAILKHTIKDHFGLKNDDLKSYEKVLKAYRKEPDDTTEEKKSLTRDEIIRILRVEEGNKTVHPAQDFTAGIMTFTVMVKSEPYLITSDKKFFSFEAAESEGFSLKHTTIDTARFSYKGISGFLEGKEAVNISALYQKIYDYITRFIRFPDKAYPAYLSLWLMGTYLFMIFRYYPYVWLNAEKGSGKTLLMEILSAVAFNGELITNPTESVIFRDISNNLITMFIDEVEQLRKRDKDTYGSLISVLNAGFNKSGVVKRCESSMDGFVVKAYSAYSPKMFAGINEIDDVLQDRTVKIPLLRKKDNETVQRYKGTTETLELQRQIRDELYVFALTHAIDVAEYYHREGADGIEGMENLNNRELDIWEPVFLLGNIVDAQRGNTELTDAMATLSRESAKEKQSDSITQNETYKILNVLKTMFDEVVPLSEGGDVRVFDAGQVFEYFKKAEDFEWIEKTNVLTRRLKKVKVVSEQRRLDGEKKRVYIVNVRDIADLCERFKI